MNWKQITSSADLEAIKAASHESPCVIFKHSTRCSISSMALSRLERSWKIDESKVQTYFLDLIAHRDISNAVAEVFSVQHESPQMLLIVDGVCTFNSSHNSISVSDVQELVGV